MENNDLSSKNFEKGATHVKDISYFDKSREWVKALQEKARKEEEELLETGFVNLPSWREDRRGVPNSLIRCALFAAIQSKDREYLQEVSVFSQKGFTVTYTGKQLNQEDLTVWLALVDLMKKDPLGTECRFTAHEILKYMDLGTSIDAYERLRCSILRMTACAVVIEAEKYTYGKNLIESFFIDRDTNKYKVTLSRHLIKLFGENDWTAVNWDERKQLKHKPLCLKFHDYYSSHQEPLPVSFEFLFGIAGSVNKQKAGFKIKAKNAFEELVKINFLREYSIEAEMVKVKRNKNSTK